MGFNIIPIWEHKSLNKSVYVQTDVLEFFGIDKWKTNQQIKKLVVDGKHVLKLKKKHDFMQTKINKTTD